jgi:Golgi phosphoprotein 3
MENSVAEQFLLLCLNPEKGRITVSDIHFRYSLTGALLMEYNSMGEFSIENKRLVPAFHKNGEVLHDLFAERIMDSTRHRRLSYWVSKMTGKSRIIIKEVTGSLEKKRILRIEQKKFLNLFPYKRYWLNEPGTREAIIENLRGILLYGKQPSAKDLMLLGLLEASRIYKKLSRERGESSALRKKNKELLKGDIVSAEISQAIREVQVAIAASVAAASAAASGHH